MRKQIAVFYSPLLSVPPNAHVICPHGEIHTLRLSGLKIALIQPPAFSTRQFAAAINHVEVLLHHNPQALIAPLPFDRIYNTQFFQVLRARGVLCA
jgi:hypothetical protein